MKPSLLKETLKVMTRLGRPVLIEGQPGLGKTQIVAQVAREMGMAFIQIHAPLMQPEDYGMPVVNAERDGVRFVVPDKFPMEGAAHPDSGILLIDEMPQADNAGQKILANLIQERELHGHRLKPGWTIVATGNRMQDRAGANRILSHLRNRMTTLEFDANLDDWCAWALKHGVAHQVVSFLRFKPQLLVDFDPQRDINPTPRAWAEGVSPIVEALPDLLGSAASAVEFDCYKGAVGEGAAAEFTAYMKVYRALPNVDVVLLQPDTHAVPEEPSVLYALAGALAARSAPGNFDRVLTFANRMPPEFTVYVVRSAVQRDPSCAETEAFTEWSCSHGADILN